MEYPVGVVCPEVYRGFFMTTPDDRKYIEEAIQLARQGAGKVHPNPLVGAVLVKDGRIIGRGYHQYWGGAHAEKYALENATESPEGATLYVTLEPCNHHGKTPPCSDLIIRNRIQRVVIGTPDPNPSVEGGGAAKLTGAGIKVDWIEDGPITDTLYRMNERFFHWVTTGKPFVTVKMAMTLDGKIATRTGNSKWVTGPESRKEVQRLRHLHPAIMAGSRTVALDNPELTDRSGEQRHQPLLRIVAGPVQNIPETHQIFNTGTAPTLLAATPGDDSSRLGRLREKGVEVWLSDSSDGKIDLARLMDFLGDRKIDALLVEGGGELVASLVEANLVNRFVFFVAPKIAGGRDAVTPVEGMGISRMEEALNLEFHEIKQTGSDLMVVAYPKKDKRDVYRAG